MARRLFNNIDSGEETSVDLTPLLDIVFIMLIFFIVTASFVRPSGIEVNEPSAKTSEKVDGKNIIISITSQNQIWLDGKNIDLRSIKLNLERLARQTPDANLIISADKNSSAESLVSVMDASRQAGLENISVAAIKK